MIKIYIGCNPDLINYHKSFEFINKRINDSSLFGNQVEIVNSPADKFEYPALHKIWQDSMDGDFYGLYLHCKGASKPCGEEFDNSLAWLDTMLYGLIDNNELCLEHLNNGAELVGSMWYRHFKGNCFWFRSDYIKGLKNPLELNKDNRFQAEYWCAQNYWWGGYRYPKVKNLFYLPLRTDKDFLSLQRNKILPDLSEKNRCVSIQNVISSKNYSVYDEIVLSSDESKQYDNIVEQYMNYDSKITILD